MKRSLLLLGLLVVAFIGIADSWYLAESALGGTALACDVTILSGCNAVAQSPYSRLFGIPYGVYGTVFYSFVFALTATVIAYPKRLAYFALYILGVVGFIASMLFVLVQANLIGEFCVYCLISAALATLIFALARSLFVRYAPVKLAVVK